MTDPLVYEVEGTVFLDRMRRSRAMQDELTAKGVSIDVADWARRMKAILREVDPIPLVIGVRYRMRAFGGPLAFEHRHYQDEAGAIHGLDLPSMADAGIIEIEGVYLGRHGPGPFQGLIGLDVGGAATAIADTDVLRCEEIR